jgi:hypothetical protein
VKNVVHGTISDFQAFKGSPKEKQFWNDIKLQGKHSTVQHDQRLDGLENTKYFGIKAGSSLRRKSSSLEILL